MRALNLLYALPCALALCSTQARADVLVYAADSDGFRDDVRLSLEGSGVELGAIDVIDARSIILTAEMASDYDAILTWGNQVYEDSIGLGDVLADYSDAGGGVVISAWGTADSFARGVQGRFADEGYMATTQGENSEDEPLTMVVLDGEHRIFDAVGSFSGGSRSLHSLDLEPTADAEILATFSNDDLLVATKTPAGRSVVLNFFPISQNAFGGGWDDETDGDLLLANALWWSMGAACGDGYVEDDEACDDANDDDTDACIACAVAACGDGVVQAGVEECDDGNDDDTDDCLSDCTIPEAASESGGDDDETGAASGTEETGTNDDGPDPDASTTGGSAGSGTSSPGETSNGDADEQMQGDDAGCGCRQSGAPSAALVIFVLGLLRRRR